MLADSRHFGLSSTTEIEFEKYLLASLSVMTTIVDVVLFSHEMHCENFWQKFLQMTLAVLTVGK